MRVRCSARPAPQRASPRRPCWNPRHERVRDVPRDAWRPLIAWLVFASRSLVLIAYAGRLSGAETPDDVAYQLVVLDLWVHPVRVHARVILASPCSRGAGAAGGSCAAQARARGRALGLAGSPGRGRSRASSSDGAVAVQLDAPRTSKASYPKGWDSSRAAPVRRVLPRRHPARSRRRGADVSRSRVHAPRAVGMLPSRSSSTGLLFGAAHGLVVGLPSSRSSGSSSAGCGSRTDSVYPGMLLHATFNGVALIAVRQRRLTTLSSSSSSSSSASSTSSTSSSSPSPRGSWRTPRA